MHADTRQHTVAAMCLTSPATRPPTAVNATVAATTRTVAAVPVPPASPTARFAEARCRDGSTCQRPNSTDDVTRTRDLVECRASMSHSTERNANGEPTGSRSTHQRGSHRPTEPGPSNRVHRWAEVAASQAPSTWQRRQVAASATTTGADCSSLDDSMQQCVIPARVSYTPWRAGTTGRPARFTIRRSGSTCAWSRTLRRLPGRDPCSARMWTTPRTAIMDTRNKRRRMR